MWLDTSMAQGNEASPYHHVSLDGKLNKGDGLAAVPVRQILMPVDAFVSGTTRLTMGLPEGFYEHDFQLVVIDLKGGDEGLGNAGAIGSASDALRADEVVDLPLKTAGFAAVSLLDMKTEDQLGYLAGLHLKLLAHRE